MSYEKSFRKARCIKMFLYYTTQRPPMPGCIPRGAVDVVFLDDKPFVSEIGRNAWGYAVYDHRLSRREVDDYELTEQNRD